MRLLTLIICVFAAMLDTSCSKSATTTLALPDTPENRRIVSQQYLNTVGIEDTYNNIMLSVAQVLPENMRSSYKETVNKFFSKEKVAKLTEDALVKHFTVAEINAMIDFYNTPEGASIAKKMGPYTADAMAEIQSAVNSPEFLGNMIKSIKQKSGSSQK